MDLQNRHFSDLSPWIGGMDFKNTHFPTCFYTIVTWTWKTCIVTTFFPALVTFMKETFFNIFLCIGNMENTYFRPSSMHRWHGFGKHTFFCPFSCIGYMGLEMIHFSDIFQRHLKGWIFLVNLRALITILLGKVTHQEAFLRENRKNNPKYASFISQEQIIIKTSLSTY